MWVLAKDKWILEKHKWVLSKTQVDIAPHEFFYFPNVFLDCKSGNIS